MGIGVYIELIVIVLLLAMHIEDYATFWFVAAIFILFAILF